jgi:hypothetical protein
MSITSRLRATWRNIIFFGAFLLVLSILTTVFATGHAAYAVPGKMNYQGRLADAAGTAKPDGLYNMKFRIYSAASGGTLLWSEGRETTNRVAVTNGQFSVQLGEVTPIPSSVFSSDNTYFEVELPSPATVTCSTAACGSYTEGAMTPRQPVASSAYAMNADTLDCYKTSDFSVGGANNTFTGTNLFKLSSASAVSIQDNGGASLFAANTSTMQVVVGSASNGIVLSANGIQLAGTARSSRVVTLSPEYAGAAFRGDGTNNTGSLSSDFCANTASLTLDTSACSTSGSIYNYYQWTTTQATAQDYDIYVRYIMPSNYDAGSMSDLRLAAQSSVSGQPISLAMYDSTGVLCTTVNGFTDAAVPNWAQGTVTSPIGGCAAIAADSTVTFKVRVTATNNSITRVGDISFKYKGKF